MATTPITLSPSSISSNNQSPIYQIEPIILNQSVSSSYSLSNNNSTETEAADQTQNGVGKSPSLIPPPTQKTNNSLLRFVLNLFKAKAKGRGAPFSEAPTNDTDTDTAVAFSEEEALCNLINAELIFIENASKILKQHEGNIKEASDKFTKLKENKYPEELRKLKKSVMILKQQISSKSKDESENRNSWTEGLKNVDQVSAQKLLDEMPHLYQKSTSSASSSSSSSQHEKSIFENSLAFREFELLYNELSVELKLCLLCFSVFPEKVAIKKRVMIYWWIAEGFLPPLNPIGPKTKEETENPKTAEDFANVYFDELLAKGFIEPVYEKRNIMVGSCKMHPFVRSAIIVLAERAMFFDFDQFGQPKTFIDQNGQPIVEFFGSLRACLVGSGFRQNEDFEKLHMVFNVNEKILELKPEWFSKMKNVNVLYLGRWQTSATHHIEVEGTKFLDGLEKMNHLRFLSLQGISRITDLPESISNLTNLTILDLRACHNLDQIPDGIGFLKSLTHLDMSECYLLDHMPKGLKSLHQLQVLKGFVAGDSKQKNSCTLDELARLEKLRKLSIYTGLKQFPGETELKALNIMQKLQKLTIAWGRGSTKKDNPTAQSGEGNVQEVNSTEETAKANTTKTPKLPSQSQKVDLGCIPIKLKVKETATVTATKGGLARIPTFTRGTTSASAVPALPLRLQKLDLQCFPITNAPHWLKPELLRDLKKLYIRGGKLCVLRQLQDLGDESPDKCEWRVEVLRLKYLTELEMNWRELRELFPELIYVEKVNCPKLTFFPCNETGVWMGKNGK